MSREERAMERRMRFKAIAGMIDFLGVIGSTILIIALIAILTALINWLVSDLTQSFATLQSSVTEALLVQ